LGQGIISDKVCATFINPVDHFYKSFNPSFIYYMSISFDACFRLKRKNVSTWKRDPSLQDGMAYFVENGPYAEWCRKMENQKEVSLSAALWIQCKSDCLPPDEYLYWIGRT
jgi:hypothetical protein